MAESQAWAEMVIAGKLFAVLTDQSAWPEMLGAESLSIDHGQLSLKLRDGRKFEIAVRLVPE